MLPWDGMGRRMIGGGCCLYEGDGNLLELIAECIISANSLVLFMGYPRMYLVGNTHCAEIYQMIFNTGYHAMPCNI